MVTGLGVGWIRGLSVPGTVNTPLSITTLIGGAFDWTAGLIGFDLAPATFLHLVRNLGTLITIGVILWVTLRGQTGDRSRALHGLAVMTAVAVLLGPVVHLWYLLWVVPFFVVMKLSRLAMAGVIAVSTIAGLVAPLDSSLHGAYLAIVLGSMLVACLVPVLLLTARARVRLEKIVTAEWLPGVPHPSPGPLRRTPLRPERCRFLKVCSRTAASHGVLTHGTWRLSCIP